MSTGDMKAGMGMDMGIDMRIDEILMAAEVCIYIVCYDVVWEVDKASATGQTNTIPFRADFTLHPIL